MLTTPFRLAVAGIAVTGIALWSMQLLDTEAPPSGPGETDVAAMEAYAAQAAAEQDAARDALAMGKWPALSADPGSPVLGNTDGDVVIVEFTDYTCTFCKAVEPRLREAVAADGRVKFVIKEFPILTPESLIAAKAALASVNQGKYEAYHQIMMDFRGTLDEAAIFEMAARVGLDVAQLQSDMAASGITDQIIANFNLARGIRIFQTPTFLIDGHIVTGPSAEIDFPAAFAAAREG
jgi:protein-disulfide isomerase